MPYFPPTTPPLRVVTITSAAQPTINTNITDVFGITAQTETITSFTANLSGAPKNGDKLWIYIVSSASVGRGITWGLGFEASTALLPTTTVLAERLDIGFVYNAVTAKWRCVAYT